MGKEVSISQVKKNMLVSVTAQVISVIVSFIINLILPKYISEYQYAYWQTYLLYVGYVGILHFGLLDGIVLRYAQFDFEELDKPRIRSQFISLLSISSIFSIIGIFSSALFVKAVDMKYVFVFAAIGIVTRNIFTYTSYSFQITNRIDKYASMIISYRLFYGIIVLGMIVIGIKDFYWYCIADLCSDIFGVFIGSLNNKGLYWGKTLRLKETLDELFSNISAGFMLMVANWSSIFLTGSARLIIQWHWDELTFGKISFSFSVSNLFLTFVTAISVVLFPSLKRSDPKKLSQIYIQIRDSVSPLLLLLLILYYPGCLILEKWLPAYNESLLYLGILLPIIVFTSKVSLLTNNYLKAYREEKKLLLINLLSLLLGVVVFVCCAYVFNNLIALVCSIVGIIALRSIASEYVVMNILNLKGFGCFIVEIIMTIVFILSTTMKPLHGVLLYSIALLAYFIIYRNSIVDLLSLISHRFKKNYYHLNN